jgi:dynein light chain LC8-type
MAGAIKKELDDQLGGPWHVIVGKSFASSISHEKNGFIYAYVDNYAVLAFRTA